MQQDIAYQSATDFSYDPIQAILKVQMSIYCLNIQVQITHS